MVTSPLPGFVTAKSGNPSPLKSRTAAAFTPRPAAVMLVGAPKPPRPSPGRTTNSTVVEL
jgi:hypothetical protein